MFTPAERAQLRAALTLWQETTKNSRIHPANIPACNAIFVMNDTLPMSDEKIDALLIALDQDDIIFISVPVASIQYHIAKHRIRRELKRLDILPTPGTKLYFLSDMILAITRIRKRDGS